MRGFALLYVVGLWCVEGIYLSSPRGRNVYTDGAYKSPLEIGAFNAGGRLQESQSGHGVCGGTPLDVGAKLTEDGPWAPTPPQGVYLQDSLIDIQVVVEPERHQFGWLEFRLCVRKSEDAVTTQECLNEYVLKFDRESTENSYKNEMREGLSSPADMVGSGNVNADHTNSRCANIKSVPAAPQGSCCQVGGECSPDELNQERWVLPKPNTDGPNGASLYKMKYRLPEGITGDNIVLQMYYQSGGTPGQYPEGYWNCADIKVLAKVEVSKSIVGPILGGTFAGALLIGAFFYARSSARDMANSQGTWGEPRSKKKNFFKGVVSRTSGAFSSRGEFPIGQPKNVVRTTNAQNNGGFFSSPAEPASPQGRKPKVMIAPPTSSPSHQSTATYAGQGGGYYESGSPPSSGFGGSPYYNRPPPPPPNFGNGRFGRQGSHDSLDV